MPDFPYLPPPVKGSSAWQPLVSFDDSSLPKLNNLRRAQAAGLRVPPTWWVFAAEIALVLNAPPPFSLAQYPLLVRCASPTAEIGTSSHSGRLLSVTSAEPAQCATALLTILNALPRDNKGNPCGAVFVQPLLKAAEAGAARFDGFYYERTSARNVSAPATDPAHPDAQRGHYERGDIWCEWLKSMYAVFGADGGPPTQIETRLEIEYLRRGDRYTLLKLQQTPRPVPRNRTFRQFDLGLNRGANSGAPLSPWTVAALMAAGQDALHFFADCDPAVHRWDEPYVMSAAGRVWSNTSVFLRMLDRWGVPRSLVTEAFGGDSPGIEDCKTDRRRLLFAAPTLFRLQIQSLRETWSMRKKLAALDTEVGAAQTLLELYEANVSAMQLAIRSQFAFGCLLAGIDWVRKTLHIHSHAPVAAHSIVEVYQPPPYIPEASHPRMPLLYRPFFYFGVRRQRFDNEMRLRWSLLREKMLAEGLRLVEAGRLDAAEDIFFLNPSQDLMPGSLLLNSRDGPLDTSDLKGAVAQNRLAYENAKAMSLQLTLSEDVLHRMTCSKIECSGDRNTEAK